MTSQVERAARLAKAALERGRAGPVVVHTKELELGSAPGRRTAYVSEPEILGSIVQSMAMLVNEIPPGGRLPKHRHMNESLMYVISGRGHTVIEGVRHDWADGDVVSEPIWTWHEHFNDDQERPVRYLGVTNIPLLRALGLNYREETAP